MSCGSSITAPRGTSTATPPTTLRRCRAGFRWVAGSCQVTEIPLRGDGSDEEQPIVGRCASGRRRTTAGGWTRAAPARRIPCVAGARLRGVSRPRPKTRPRASSCGATSTETPCSGARRTRSARAAAGGPPVASVRRYLAAAGATRRPSVSPARRLSARSSSTPCPRGGAGTRAAWRTCHPARSRVRLKVAATCWGANTFLGRPTGA